MLLSFKWLSELVELPQGVLVKDIGEYLTMAGLEVESLEQMAPALKGMKIAQIVKIESHPSKSDLRVCTIDVGNETHVVVCGAKNFSENDWAIYAPAGTQLADGTQIANRKVGGVASSGMLCSEKELGLSDDHSGILIVPPDYEPVAGADARATLKLDDTILEIKITPNRPDALSHAGVARELSAILQTRAYFSNPSVKELAGPIHDVVQVTVVEKNACPRYACRVIDGVQIAPSPLWLRMRLAACGIRPINNVVDITNLVLLERGHPLHAFDLGSLSKDRSRAMINVRFAQKGEKLVTLDGKERQLAEEDLVIADAEQAIALAGVMGGQNSEVSDETTQILLESAYFDPSVVRQTARRHQLSTEGSYRFERGADPNGVMIALDRASELISLISGGKIRREAIDVYPKQIGPVEISVRRQKIAEISGLPEQELDEAKIRARFLLLGIETVGRRSGDALSFRVPTFRPDLTREIDLIEEAMRLIGFDKVPTRMAFSKRVSGLSDDHQQNINENVRHSLIAAGFYEAVNFSFGSPSRFSLFKKHDANVIRVENPLGEELSVMRQSLLPWLLDNVLFNVNRGAQRVALFEIGTVFMGPSPHGKVPNRQSLEGRANQDSWADERLHVAGVRMGAFGIESFDVQKRKNDFFDLKGILEELFVNLKIPPQYVSQRISFAAPKLPHAFLHPGVAADITIKTDGGEAEAIVGFIGQIHPDVEAAFELKEPAFVFELDLRTLARFAKEYQMMKPLPKFPAVERDLALLLDDGVTAGQVTTEILKSEEIKPLLQDLRIFDVYKGDNIEAGKKSVAVSLTLRAADRTLTDEEVAELMKPLMSSLQKQLGAHIR